MSSTPPPEPLPHSGLGIASCLLALVAGTLFWGYAFAIFFLNIMTLGFFMKDTHDQVLLLFMLFAAAVALALALGIAGFFQQERRKLMPTLGCIVSMVAALPALALVDMM